MVRAELGRYRDRAVTPEAAEVYFIRRCVRLIPVGVLFFFLEKRNKNSMFAEFDIFAPARRNKGVLWFLCLWSC